MPLIEAQVDLAADEIEAVIREAEEILVQAEFDDLIHPLEAVDTTTGADPALEGTESLTPRRDRPAPVGIRERTAHSWARSPPPAMRA